MDRCGIFSEIIKYITKSTCRILKGFLMKKIYQIILAWVSVGLLVLLLSKKYALEDIAQPLNSYQTAQLISKLYKELGPRIGSHLVEPNVVITFAGLRGSGNFLMLNLTNTEMNNIEKLNQKINKLGIRFLVYIDVEHKITDITIHNLKGIEYLSKVSKLPFVKPFDWTRGFDGASLWLNDVRNKAEKYFNIKTEDNLSIEALNHLIIGLLLGYPDQALLDLYNVNIRKNLDVLVPSEIPYANYYDNPQPNFSHLPEHKNEESIVKIKKSWGHLLKDFYTSSWHKSIAKDPYFRQVRKAEEKAHQEWFMKRGN